MIAMPCKIKDRMIENNSIALSDERLNDRKNNSIAWPNKRLKDLKQIVLSYR